MTKQHAPSKMVPILGRMVLAVAFAGFASWMYLGCMYGRSASSQKENTLQGLNRIFNDISSARPVRLLSRLLRLRPFFLKPGSPDRVIDDYLGHGVRESHSASASKIRHQPSARCFVLKPTCFRACDQVMSEISGEGLLDFLHRDAVLKVAVPGLQVLQELYGVLQPTSPVSLPILNASPFTSA